MTRARRRQSRLLRGLAGVTTAVGIVLLSACGGDINVRSLPLREDFSDCGTFTMNDEVSTVDCPDSELRVLVAQPAASPIQIVPLRFEPPTDAMAVAADVRDAAGSSAHGVGCAVSQPGEPGRGYLFLLIRGPGQGKLDGKASIVRLDWSEEEGQTVQPLGVTQTPVVARDSHRLEGVCDASGSGSGQLRLLIDGKTVVQARDPSALRDYRAGLAVVVASAPDSDVRFDDVSIENGAG